MKTEPLAQYYEEALLKCDLDMEIQMNTPKEDTVRLRLYAGKVYLGKVGDDLERLDTSLSVLRDNLSSVLRENLLSEESNSDFHRKIETILSAINYMNEALELWQSGISAILRRQS